MPLPERYARAHDLDSWRHDERIARRGFTHPWVSRIAEGNGEDSFVARAFDLVGPDDVVLDLGCGHGELAIALAARARAVIGVDREPAYLELARELAAEAGATNARFVEFAFQGRDSGRLEAGIAEAAAGPVTVVVDRRGPTVDKWIDEVRPIARSGSPVLLMHPAGGPPSPGWADELVGLLPPSLQGIFEPVPPDVVASWVSDPLQERGIDDFRLWWFDVPEWFDDAGELWRRLAGGRAGSPSVPAYGEVFAVLQGILDRCGSVALRHRRLVARFELPALGCST